MIDRHKLEREGEIVRILVRLANVMLLDRNCQANKVTLELNGLNQLLCWIRKIDGR